MYAILRFVGLMNAAVWLGGAVFFSCVAAPAIFQPAMKRLFHPYYIGLVAQLMQERYFLFHLACGGIALLHTAGYWLLRRRESQRVMLSVLAAICVLNLAGTFLLLPTMKSLFQTEQTAPTQVQRDQAKAAFFRWHGVTQSFNLVIMGGLVFYVWRMAAPTVENRYGKSNPFAPSSTNAERVG